MARSFPVAAWDPLYDRHNLFSLLDRLQRDFTPDLKSIVLGIFVLGRTPYLIQNQEEKLVSAKVAACVVPSWPRVENDCLIICA